MKSVYIVTLLLTTLFLGSCDNSTESDGLKNKLYIQIKDKNGTNVEDVGLHFYANINLYSDNNNIPLVESNAIDLADTVFIPNTYKLYQNYPNPFNPETTIMFSIPKSGKTTLNIMNRVDSTLVRMLIDQNLPEGMHSVVWDGTNDLELNVTNNVYSYQLVMEGFKDVKNLFLNMIDPEHIKSLECIPLEKSDSEGKIELEYNNFPIQEEVVWVDENGMELGTITIPDSLRLVLIKEGYKPKTKAVIIDLSKPLELSIVLEN